MTSLDMDLYYTWKIINGEDVPINYGKIYMSTNDSMNLIDRFVDVYDKDVLTVLGSGDQAFHFMNGGARSVDLFDINKLSIYYYYLRVWQILYLDSFHPRNGQNLVSPQYIDKILSSVTELSSSLERDAYNYWKTILSKYNNPDYLNSKLFYCDYSLLGNKITSLSILKSKLKSGVNNFYNVDMTKTVDINKQYDIIFVSNILEWIKSKRWDVNTFNDNLYNLLNDNGMVICTKFNLSEASDYEKRIFSSNFDYSILNRYGDDYVTSWTPGYIYTKKPVKT